MRIVMTALLAAGAISAPVHAADLATIDCVAGKLDAAVKAQIEADAARNLGEAGKRPTYDPSVSRGLNDAATACAKDNGWTPAATKAAGIYALARIGVPVAQRVVGERGFDSAALEDQFQALPEETRDRPLTAAENQELIKAAVTDEDKQTRENAELLAEFFAFLSTIQYAAHDFSVG
ncbi:hypothetical protein [Sphingomonas sp. dw_22]|uniref:hypothetical protein n=1 Tax=Sphingomonas sp. dw_22 TaxID=2721175 RepID=UPI001BD28774|nr:hypothetical protein [Sphingomonas sp. dw_22]